MITSELIEMKVYHTMQISQFIHIHRLVLESRNLHIRTLQQQKKKVTFSGIKHMRKYAVEWPHHQIGKRLSHSLPPRFPYTQHAMV